MKKQTLDKVFLDTNVFIYAYSANDEKRRKIAQQLIKAHEHKIVISTQVINEFASVLRRKWKYDIDIIAAGIEEIRSFSKVHIVGIATIKTALAIMKRYNYAFFDSLMLASAYKNQCSIIYSEDMHNSQVIFDRVKIKNPFVPD